MATARAATAEARVSWALNDGQSVSLVAFGLPAEEAVVAAARGGARASMPGMPAMRPLLLGGVPWVIFPNTNPLGEPPTTPFTWDTPLVLDMNEGQPVARTVNMTVTSPQDVGAAWCPASTLVYDIVLTNPELEAHAGLTLTADAQQRPDLS